MFKKIAMVITLVLTLCLGMFIWNMNQEEKNQIAAQEKVESAKRPLLVKKEKIERKLDNLNRDYKANISPKATTQVIFTGLEADVYNICYPIMKKFGYTGILAVSLTQLPGMEGRMSLEQFQEMIQSGWKICIKWDAETPVRNWWPKLQKQVKQLGLETGDVVYFTTGTYKSSLDSQLTTMGFSVVVHHGEESESLIQTKDEEGLWHLGSVGLMGEKPKLRLTQAIQQNGNITYLVGFELEDEMYKERSFLSMLSYFDAYEANMDLIVSDMQGARQHYREREDVHMQAKVEEYNQEKAALEVELAAVEEELAKVEPK